MKYIMLFEDFQLKIEDSIEKLCGPMLAHGRSADVYISKSNPEHVVKVYRNTKDRDTKNMLGSLKDIKQYDPLLFPTIHSINFKKAIVIMERVEILSLKFLQDMCTFLDITELELDEDDSAFNEGGPMEYAWVMYSMYENDDREQFIDMEHNVEIIERQLQERGNTVQKKFFEDCRDLCDIGASVIRRSTMDENLDFALGNIGKTKDGRLVLVDI